jgi:flagellar hook-associated protein 1 FlgK
MSSSLSNIALTGLSAGQNALNSVASNISNVYVSGYNRQTTQLAEMGTNGATGAGTGVQVTGVSRAYDALLMGQLRDASSTSAASTSYSDQISQINSLFSSTTSSLSTSMSTFFSSLQSLSSNAGDSAARQTVIGSAQSLVSQFQSNDSYLRNLDDTVNKQLSTSADQINTYATQIANLNDQIVRQGSDGASNAMLDQRDQLVNSLNQLVGVTTTTQKDNSVTVSFAGGLTLVQGNTAAQVKAVASQSDATRTVLAYDNGIGSPTVINEKSLSTGSVGGVLAFRSGPLDTARNQLGQIAVALAGSFNAQHVQGVDLNGNPGANFFNYGQPSVIGNTKNSVGGATLTATFADTSAVKASSYNVKYDGSAWQVTRASDGTSVSYTTTANSDGSSTLGFDGLAVNISGTPAANDQYTLNPTANVIAGMSVAVTDPSAIAAGQAGTDNGASDNRNAQALLALQTGQVVGGSATLSSAYASLISSVGTEASNATITATSQTNIVTQLTTKQQSISGVNLDEEYADLQRYQQYYQANAQVLTTAGTLFTTILSAVNN